MTEQTGERTSEVEIPDAARLIRNLEWLANGIPAIEDAKREMKLAAAFIRRAQPTPTAQPAAGEASGRERAIFDAGFRACRTMGDNAFHYHGEQADRIFAASMKELPAPQAMPEPDVSDAERASDHQHRLEKRRRLYYQQIVYDVCRMLDAHVGSKPGEGIVCGTADTPCAGVQNELRRILQATRGDGGRAPATADVSGVPAVPEHSPLVEGWRPESVAADLVAPNAAGEWRRKGRRYLVFNVNKTDGDMRVHPLTDDGYLGMFDLATLLPDELRGRWLPAEPAAAESGEAAEQRTLYGCAPDADELAKRARDITQEQANELQDILRTLTASGPALATSARELRDCWEKQKARAESTAARLAEVEAELAERDSILAEFNYSAGNKQLRTLGRRMQIAIQGEKTERTAREQAALAAATKGRDLQERRADSAEKLLDDLEAAYESVRPYPANYRPSAWEHVCDLIGELPGLLSATTTKGE